MRPLACIDRAGRRQQDPKLLGHGPTLTVLCAQAGMPLAQVPQGFWSLDADLDGESVAVIACPCGEVHRARQLEGPTGGDECPRGYFFDGAAVWVLNSPAEAVTRRVAVPGLDVPDEPPGVH